jgi:hypothetical protein
MDLNLPLGPEEPDHGKRERLLVPLEALGNRCNEDKILAALTITV